MLTTSNPPHLLEIAAALKGSPEDKICRRPNVATNDRPLKRGEDLHVCRCESFLRLYLCRSWSFISPIVRPAAKNNFWKLCLTFCLSNDHALARTYIGGLDL